MMTSPPGNAESRWRVTRPHSLRNLPPTCLLRARHCTPSLTILHIPLTRVSAQFADAARLPVVGTVRLQSRIKTTGPGSLGVARPYVYRRPDAADDSSVYSEIRKAFLPERFAV